MAFWTGFPSSPTSRPGFRLSVLLLIFLGVMLLAADAAASSQRGRVQPEEAFRNPYAWPGLEEMVARSDTIVAGEVLDMRSSWTADRSEIFTTVTLRPERRFKGGERTLIRFRIPGGTVGDTRLMVTHSAVFSVGERALVFLRGDSGRLPQVVAGEAGKRHLRMGEDGGQVILPGFALDEAGSGAMVGLDTLDDLGRAMPGLLVAAASR